MPDLFVINPPENSKGLATWDSSVDLEEIHCPLNAGHQRGGKRIGKLSVDMPACSLGADLVWTWMSECLVRSNAAQALSNSHLNGFEAQPARVTVGHKKYEESFRELIVTGWGGLANPASGVRLLQSCPGCGLLTYSGVEDWEKLVDGRGWDGSDLFIVWPLPRFIIATERAAAFVESARFTGVRVIPLAKMTGASENLAPGRVSYWLQEGRMNELSIDPAIR